MYSDKIKCTDFFMKTYAMGIIQCLSDASLMTTTHNMFSLRNEKNSKSFLLKEFDFIKSYGIKYQGPVVQS